MKKLILAAVVTMTLTGCAVLPYGDVSVSTPNIAIQGTVDYRLPNPYYVPPKGYYRGY